jgi:two-component system sensor histidine kinase UhpB
MWKRLSLRMRLLLPLGTMFVAALLLGAVSLQLFAPGQLIEENEPAARTAKAVAEALNSALLISTNPQATLDASAPRSETYRTGSSLCSACRNSARRFQ